MAQLTEEEMKELTEKFRAYDANGDGTIDSSELKTVMHNLKQNPTNAEVREMIEAAEANTPEEERNGRIEFREFVDLMAKRGGLSTSSNERKKMKKAFKVFDEDGDGKIDAGELKRVLTKMGEVMTEEEVDEMIREADVDNDGRVDFDEFVKVMNF